MGFINQALGHLQLEQQLSRRAADSGQLSREQLEEQQLLSRRPREQLGEQDLSRWGDRERGARDSYPGQVGMCLCVIFVIKMSQYLLRS
jgi:hypothetical protein